MTPRIRSIARLSYLAVVWGSSFMWITICLTAMPPALISLMRISLATVILGGLALLARQPLPPRRLLVPIAFFGLFGLALPYTLYPIAQRTISSALAGSLNATTPAWTLILTWIFARKSVGKPTMSGIAGIAIGLAGVVLMLRPWEASGTLTGSLIALCASAC
ncbi:MAG: DMT family transporter [Propionibacteriaceae bacterium]